MNFLDILKIIFCCFIPKKKKSQKLAAGHRFVQVPKSCQKRVNRRRRLAMDRHQYMVFIRSRGNYAELRHRIMCGITFDIQSTVIVWCPQNMVPNDYISTMLHRYGQIRYFINKWTNKKDSLASTWAGAVVQYWHNEAAVEAVKDLSMRCRDIRILPLSDVLPHLVDSELLYPWTDRSSSKLIIFSNDFPMLDTDANSLYEDLTSYGGIRTYFLNNRQISRAKNAICVVKYPFLTQAYLAMLMTDGRRHGMCNLRSKIIENKRDEDILKDAREYVMLTTGEYFPN